MTSRPGVATRYYSVTMQCTVENETLLSTFVEGIYQGNSRYICCRRLPEIASRNHVNAFENVIALVRAKRDFRSRVGMSHNNVITLPKRNVA
jgi:hypothetical protein